MNRFPIIVSQMTARYFVLLGMGFWSCLLLADDSPDFNQKIRPILAKNQGYLVTSPLKFFTEISLKDFDDDY